MANPFDDEQGAFLVLQNQENQYSLWPQIVPVPGGWSVVMGPGDRGSCLEFIDHNWIDMRPKSLIDAMAGME